MTGAVFVVTSARYGTRAALPTAATAGMVAWLWFALPLQGPRRDRPGR